MKTTLILALAVAALAPALSQAAETTVTLNLAQAEGTGPVVGTVRLLQPLAIEPGHALTVWAWNDADPTPRRASIRTTATRSNIRASCSS